MSVILVTEHLIDPQVDYKLFIMLHLSLFYHFHGDVLLNSISIIIIVKNVVQFVCMLFLQSRDNMIMTCLVLRRR